MDLHRKRSHVVALDPAGQVIVSRRIGNAPAEFLRIFGELEPHPVEVVFEATYGWSWFADLLADAGIPAHMAHPLATKAISAARVKNDAVDAKTLAHLLRTNLLAEAWIAPPAAREARRLVRTRAGLVRMRSRVQSQLHALLADLGVIPELTTLFGPAGRRWLAELPLPVGARGRLDAGLRLVDAITVEVGRADADLRASFAGDARTRRLLPIPGIGLVTAATVIAEVSPQKPMNCGALANRRQSPTSLARVSAPGGSRPGRRPGGPRHQRTAAGHTSRPGRPRSPPGRHRGPAGSPGSAHRSPQAPGRRSAGPAATAHGRRSRPTRPEHPAVAQQELAEPMPGPGPVGQHVGAGAAQVPDGLLGDRRDPDGDQLAGPVQASQPPAVATVGLDLVAGGLGDQRRRDHLAVHAHAVQQPGQLIAGGSGLVAGSQPAWAGEPGHQPAHRRLVVGDPVHGRDIVAGAEHGHRDRDPVHVKTKEGETTSSSDTGHRPAPSVWLRPRQRG